MWKGGEEVDIGPNTLEAIEVIATAIILGIIMVKLL